METLAFRDLRSRGSARAVGLRPLGCTLIPLRAALWGRSGRPETRLPHPLGEVRLCPLKVLERLTGTHGRGFSPGSDVFLSAAWGLAACGRPSGSSCRLRLGSDQPRPPVPGQSTYCCEALSPTQTHLWGGGTSRLGAGSCHTGSTACPRQGVPATPLAKGHCRKCSEPYDRCGVCALSAPRQPHPPHPAVRKQHLHLSAPQ